MKYIYQFGIALPLVIVPTLLCALITIVCAPWKNSWWLNRIQAYWARIFCWLFFIPVTVTGAEHIRRGQSYVFVSNHQSIYDAFVIYGWLPVIFKWMMKKEIRKLPFVGTACRAAGHIFVDRHHLRAAAESIQAVEQQLQGGVSTVIFAEGTRTRTGQMGPFKRGAFHIAGDLHLPIVPISLSGCYDVWPVGRVLIERHPITLHIGEPIDPQQFETQEELMNYVHQKVEEGIHA